MVPLTQVCRRWRQSLTSIPENWTVISNENLILAAVSLRLAKAAPLEITIFMPPPTVPFRFSRIFEAYVQNTRNLVVCHLSTIQQFTERFPNFPQSMPRLQSLELNSAGGDPFDEDWSINPFGAFTFPLRSLSLSEIPLYPSLLGITTLTVLTLRYSELPLSLDSFLDFLEGNHSLKIADLELAFAEPPPRNPQRQIQNQLQCLTIQCGEPGDAQALVASIPLRRGAHLNIHILDSIAGVNDILPNLPATHLSNPPSPTFFQFQRDEHGTNTILLCGPGGELSFEKYTHPGDPFPDFHRLPLANVREFRFSYRNTVESTIPNLLVFHPPLFPSLEALAIKYTPGVRQVLSTLLSNPTSSPLLKTLAFLNCELPEELMKELTKFASERKKTLTSTWLYRVLIVRHDSKFPSADSITELRKYVRVVDVWMGNELPKDLTRWVHHPDSIPSCELTQILSNGLGIHVAGAVCDRPCAPNAVSFPL